MSLVTLAARVLLPRLEENEFNSSFSAVEL